MDPPSRTLYEFRGPAIRCCEDRYQARAVAPRAIRRQADGTPQRHRPHLSRLTRRWRASRSSPQPVERATTEDHCPPPMDRERALRSGQMKNLLAVSLLPASYCHRRVDVRNRLAGRVEPAGLQTAKPAAAAPASKPRISIDPRAHRLYPGFAAGAMLLCAASAGQSRRSTSGWRRIDTRRQRAAGCRRQIRVRPGFAALVIFPDVVAAMASQLEWTTYLGQAAADRSAVFAAFSACARGEPGRQAEHAAAGRRDQDDVER